MNKNLEKNRLDLAYQRQLVYLNSILTFITIGLLSFFGTFIWNKNYVIYGFLILVIIFIISYVLYSRIDKSLKEISEKIKDI